MPVPSPSTNSPSSYPLSSQTPRRRPSLASPSPPTPLIPFTSSSTPLKNQRAPPAPLVLPVSTSSPSNTPHCHNESAGSSTGTTPYLYSSKSRPSTAGSRTSGRSQSVSMPLISNSPQPLGVGVSLSGTGTTAVPPDSPGARAMMKRLLANPSPAGERGGYTSPGEREREKGYVSPYGATSGSESEGFGLYISAAGWTRRGVGSPSPSSRVGDASSQGWKYGSGSESGHGHATGLASYGRRGKHKGWRSTSGEDTNGETELPYYTRSGSGSGSQSESPYVKALGIGVNSRQLQQLVSSTAEDPPSEETGKEKEKRQRNVLKRRPSAKTSGAATSTPAPASTNGQDLLAPSLPTLSPISPISLSVPIPTIGSISAPQSPAQSYTPSISPLPSPSLNRSNKNLQRSASASALKPNNPPSSPRHRSSAAGLSRSTTTAPTGQTVTHGATLRPPLPYGQSQQLYAQGGLAGESVVSLQSGNSRSRSSRGSSPMRSPVVSTLVPVSRTGSGSASGHGSARGSGGGGKSPIRERPYEKESAKESLRERERSHVHMTPAEALVAAYKKQQQEEEMKAEKEKEAQRAEDAALAQKDGLK
ncbi:hypothetical protein CVT24_000226, partial [Panaeolus cyanescens]